MKLFSRLTSVCAVLALAAALSLGCTGCSGDAAGTPDASSAAPDAASAAASASLPEPAPESESLPEPEPEPEPDPEVSPSDNWQDMQLVVENVLISLPDTVEQVEKTGFMPYSPADSSDVEPGQWGVLYSESSVYNSMALGFGVYNPGTEAASPMECQICDITFSFFGIWEETDAKRRDVKLAGGITLYSNLQDIIDAYGEPDTINRMDSIPDSTYCDITYRTPEGHMMMFAFDGEDQHIMTAKISCAIGD